MTTASVCRLLLFLAVSALTSAVALADEASDAYSYPIVPGTPEWQELKSHDAMLAACQVPEDLLSRMSTAGLVETCLTYPMSGDLFAYDCLQDGVDRVIAGFNGLQELLSRPDAAAALMRARDSLSPAQVHPDWASIRRGQYSRHLAYLELLLSQESCLAVLAPSARRQLTQSCLDWLDAKANQPSTFGKQSAMTTGLTMGRALLRTTFAPFVQAVEQDSTLATYLARGCTSGTHVLDLIVAYATQYLATSE